MRRPFGDQFLGRGVDRSAANRQRARATGTAAKADCCGVALHHPDLFERQTEPLGGELGIGGVMALARGLGSHQHRQGTARLEAQFGKFVGRHPRLLDIDGVPDAAITAASGGLGAPRRKTVEIGSGERIVHVAREIAAVIDEAQRGRIGHRLGSDEIAPAQFLRRDTEPAGGEIDRVARSHRPPPGVRRRDRRRPARCA